MPAVAATPLSQPGEQLRFTDAPPEHFAIVRPPHRDDYNTDAEYEARAAQHRLWAKDLRRYGLIAVEIDDYDEVPDLLRQIERRVSLQRVWISGSWPIESADSAAANIYTLAEGIGRAIGTMGRSLVSGGGQVVGSAAIGGFLDALRVNGGWDLERRLIARPFPQPLAGKPADRKQWTALRQELARLSGVVILLGGLKTVNGAPEIADGVLEEAQHAEAAGVFLLPVGATGGAAREVADRLRGSSLKADGQDAMRPTDDELSALGDTSSDTNDLIKLVTTILKRVGKVV